MRCCPVTLPVWRAVTVTFEQEVLGRHAEFAQALEQHGDAARRSLRLRIQEFATDYSDETLRLQFMLQTGAFATAVLREIAVYEDASRASATT